MWGVYAGTAERNVLITERATQTEAEEFADELNARIGRPVCFVAYRGTRTDQLRPLIGGAAA